MKYMVFGFQFLFKNAVCGKLENKNLIRWSSFYFFRAMIFLAIINKLQTQQTKFKFQIPTAG